VFSLFQSEKKIFQIGNAGPLLTSRISSSSRTPIFFRLLKLRQVFPETEDIVFFRDKQ